jgi:prevent-host-death family protein
MITNLKQAKARLSALVATAQKGEDVLITVRGRPAATLSGTPAAKHASMVRWIAELKALHRKYGTGRKTAGTSPVIDSIREERC